VVGFLDGNAGFLVGLLEGLRVGFFDGRTVGTGVGLLVGGNGFKVGVPVGNDVVGS